MLERTVETPPKVKSLVRLAYYPRAGRRLPCVVSSLRYAGSARLVPRLPRLRTRLGRPPHEPSRRKHALTWAFDNRGSLDLGSAVPKASLDASRSGPTEEYLR